MMVRYKHTGSGVPDFVFAEHLDHATRTWTIIAEDFDSLAIGDLVIRNQHGIVAHEDEAGSESVAQWSIVVEIHRVRYAARIVQQRKFGPTRDSQVNVLLTPI
jgi:hypothetical protein